MGKPECSECSRPVPAPGRRRTTVSRSAALSEMNPSGAKRAQPSQSGSRGGRHGGQATQPGSQSAAEPGQPQSSEQPKKDEARRKSLDRHDKADREAHKREFMLGQRDQRGQLAGSNRRPDRGRPNGRLALEESATGNLPRPTTTIEGIA